MSDDSKAMLIPGYELGSLNNKLNDAEDTDDASALENALAMDNSQLSHLVNLGKEGSSQAPPSMKPRRSIQQSNSEEKRPGIRVDRYNVPIITRR